MESVKAQMPELSRKHCQCCNKIHFVHDKVDDRKRVSHEPRTILQQKASPIMIPAGYENSSHAINRDKVNMEAGSSAHRTEQRACEVWPTLNDAEPFPMDLSDDTRKELIPDGVMSVGDSVEYMKITDLLQSKKPYLEVVVVEVFTPSFFWVQLYDKQKKFDQFMKDLHRFYTSKHVQYRIPSIVLKEGVNCACIYNGAWHRGMIKAVKPNQRVTVMFYDYGTLKTYPSDAVCYLHKMFSYLPTQAIPCGLANVRPYKGSKWSLCTSHSFALRTMDTPLIAIIASVNIKDNSMIITLTDTSQGEDIHINNWLVERRHAQHGRTIYGIDMGDIMQYVEEELLIAPENYCGMEDSNSTIEDTMNVPLITPKSTLKPTVPTFSFGDKVMQDQLQQHSKSLKNNNTNPFLRNKPTNDQFKAELRQTNLLQLRHENLQLQTQITNILSILLNRVNTDSTIQGSNKVSMDRDILNAIKVFFHYLANKPLQLNTHQCRRIKQTNPF